MATIPAHENEFPSLLFVEAAAPATPGTGLIIAYAKAGGVFAWKDDAGVEHVIGETGALDLDDLADVDTTGVADGDVLTFDTGSGDWIAAAPAGGGGGAVLQLDYLYAGSDHSGTSISAATWTDMAANQNFDVDSATSVLSMGLRLSGQVHVTSGDKNIQTRLLIDGATSLYMSAWHYNVTQYMGMPSGSAYIAGLSVGTHTVKPQIRADASGDFYLRPSATSGIEYLRIQIVELGS